MSIQSPLVPDRRRPLERRTPAPARIPSTESYAWPSGAPVAPADAPSTSWTLVDLERYEVRRGHAVVGFIDVIGRVFVALVGARYDHAVEVAQTLTFDDAVAAVTVVHGPIDDAAPR